MLEHETIIQMTRTWVESWVIAENLCPFARKPFLEQRIQYRVSAAQHPKQLLSDLQAALEELSVTPSSNIETTLLIHPYVLQDFFAYNEFLDEVDELVWQTQLEGVIQVASFHPAYQFAHTELDDVENYTNRSPYPMLHLIREASIEQALQHYPNSEAIPERNIAHLQALGRSEVQARLKRCQ